MADNTQQAVGIGIGVPLGAILIVIVAVLWYRRRMLINKSRNGYNRVSHELDEEEIEFKKMIESRGNDIDDLFASDINDFEFDSKDKDRLNMLENFRNNLAAGAGLNSESEASDIEAGDTFRL